MDFMEEVSIQSARNAAYRDGAYELLDKEGFTCNQCGWRGLSAPLVDDWSADDDDIVQCPECNEATLETHVDELDWEEVRERVPDEYLNGE